MAYLHCVSDVSLLKGAGLAIRRLNDLAIPIYIVTNQSVVGRGLINDQQLMEIHERLTDLLAEQGAYVDGIFYCPHVPEHCCDCRKPRPGLLLQAAEHASAEAASGVVIGDNLTDMLMALAVGARAIHVQSGVISEWPNEYGIPSVLSLADAVDLLTGGSCRDI